MTLEEKTLRHEHDEDKKYIDGLEAQIASTNSAWRRYVNDLEKWHYKMLHDKSLINDMGHSMSKPNAPDQFYANNH